jgi:hypothetical protein
MGRKTCFAFWLLIVKHKARDDIIAVLKHSVAKEKNIL